jgi:hypothetical protein
MRHVDFDPENLPEDLKQEWSDWMEKARKATVAAIDDWESAGKVQWKQPVWSELKKWLLEHVFYDKCAYCETRAVRDPGDAEHFRPKGSVAQTAPPNGSKSKTRVRVKTPDDKEADHPGYFWLAYNWRNLLPACNDCNSSEGKMDQFPVKKGHRFLVELKAEDLSTLKDTPHPSVKWPGWYYLGPRDLNQREAPLLLHPYFDAPERHLKFGYAGIEAAVDNSEMGKYSIQVYNLDEDKLRQERQQAQSAAWLKYQVASGSRNGTPEENFQAARDAVMDYIQGTRPYSAAVCDWIELNDRRNIRGNAAGGTT